VTIAIDKKSNKHAKKSYPPQNFYPRKNANPIQKLDQASLEKRERFLSRPGVISPYEAVLIQKLEAEGLTVHPQFTLGDMDNGDKFEWRYDLYVEKQPSDRQNGLLVEVDGYSHNSPFQQKQDARKGVLAKLLGFGPVLRLKNDDVSYLGVVDRVKRALQLRQNY